MRQAKLRDDLWQQSSHHSGESADRNFSGRGVGQELKLFDTLTQFIERSDGSIDKCAPEGGGHRPVPVTIEEPRSDRGFKISKCLGDDRRRDRKVFGGLDEAATLRDRQQNMQVTKFDPPSNAVFRVYRHAIIIS
jgi:hypothetical protein